MQGQDNAIFYCLNFKMESEIFCMRCILFGVLFFLFFQNNTWGSNLSILQPAIFPVTGVIMKPSGKHPGIQQTEIKQVEKLLGRKLSWKEKIILKIFQYSRNRHRGPAGKIILSNKGKTAFILALIGAIVLLIPFLDLASFPLAILAIVIGSKAKKENPRDRKARAAIKIGIATLAFLVTIGLVSALVLTLGSFPR
jgi:ABC-type dipeptide/oligopeptide/nickel transport system permease component